MQKSDQMFWLGLTSPWVLIRYSVVHKGKHDSCVTEIYQFSAPKPTVLPPQTDV